MFGTNTLKGISKPIVLLALFFALLTSIGFWTDRYDGFGYLNNQLIGFIALFAVSFIAFLLILAAGFNHIEKVVTSLKGKTVRTLDLPYWSYVIILLLCWMPYLVICAPGSPSGDLYSQVPQWLGVIPMTMHHPPLSSALYGVLFSLGNCLGGSFGSLLFIMCAQALSMACSIAYMLHTLQRFGCPRAISLFSLAFCALFPIFPTYAQWLVKDTFSACALCAFLTSFFACLLDKSRCETVSGWIISFALGVLACLLRNNNLFIVVGAYIAYSIASHLLQGGMQRKALVAATGTAVLCMIVSSAIYPALGIEKGSVKEALSMPIQQIARCIRDNPEDISEEQRQVIETTLGNSLEGIAANYDESISDPVKDSFQFSGYRNLLKFIKVWFELGLSHPGDYLASAIMGSNGYWYPFGVRAQESNFYSSQAPVSPLTGEEPLWSMLGMDPAYSLFPEEATSLARICWSLSQVPVLSLFYHPATYLWIELSIALFVSLRWEGDSNVRALGIAFVAAVIILTLTCCASPVNALVRYALALWFLFPWALAFPFLQKANTCPPSTW